MSVHAVYHVAGINHWREIVNEQLGVLAAAKFSGTLTINFSGPPHEPAYIHGIVKRYGLPEADIRNDHLDISNWEFPAFRLIEKIAAQAAPTDCVLYFHTKSVTQPNNWARMMWRLFMNAVCLRGWKELEETLVSDSGYNCAGTGWLAHNWPTSMFPGTFFMARTDFLSTLQPFDSYAEAFWKVMEANRHMTPMGKRHAAEHWIQCNATARPYNVGPSPSQFWNPNWWLNNPTYSEQAIRLGLP